MYSINEELKEKISYLNRVLSDKYRDILSLDKGFIRNFIEKNIGPIIKIDKLAKEELAYYSERGGILGVDGSSNRIGGAYPHFIEIYQGLAKSTLYKDKPIYKTDFYTPLYMDDRSPLENSPEEEIIIRQNKLSTVEIEAALEGIRKFHPYAVIMDGSLIRYAIESSAKWKELREVCEKKGILLIGVIEDIKTSIIGNKLKEDKSLSIKECFYDRELLYGLLEYGEVILIESQASKKARKGDEGFASLFMRSSQAPAVIGMDILDSQREDLEEMARLILTLTPKDGRGIPLWIDIVDSEVRIPDKMIRTLLEANLDRKILEIFFISQREKRTL